MTLDILSNQRAEIFKPPLSRLPLPLYRPHYQDRSNYHYSYDYHHCYHYPYHYPYRYHYRYHSPTAPVMSARTINPTTLT